jgi:WD40 repeat protein
MSPFCRRFKPLEVALILPPLLLLVGGFAARVIPLTLRKPSLEEEVNARPLRRGEVRDMAFSPNGQILATGGNRCRAQWWDTQTGRLEKTVLSNGFWISDVLFSPDGKIFAAAEGNFIHLYDGHTGRALRVLKGPAGYLGPVEISPDNRTIAAGVDPSSFPFDVGDICVWDIASGRQLARLDGGVDSVDALEFSPDSKLLAAAVEKRGGRSLKDVARIHLWDLRTRRRRWEVKGYYSKGDVRFSPDAQTVIAGDNSPMMLDVSSGSRVAYLQSPHDAGQAQERTFIQNGRVLVSSFESQPLTFWDTVTGDAAVCGESGADFGSAIEHFCFSKNEMTFAQGNGQGIVKMWDTSDLIGEDVIKNPTVLQLPRLLWTLEVEHGTVEPA